MNSADLLLYSPTKLAMEQWLEARGLGDSFQDTDPQSPTFGDWFYAHTDTQNSNFLYWVHPTGKLYQTYDLDVSDPENPVLTTSYYGGFYGILRYFDPAHFEATLAPWIRSNMASVPDTGNGFPGVGADGVFLVDVTDVQAHLDNIGAPGHEWLGTGIYSDPNFWYLSPVMIGDQREFGDPPVLYESLIDFNVWTVEQFPAGWAEVADPPAGEWAAGVTYATNDEVTYQGTTYRCLQGHTSIVGWEPPNVPALWTPV